MQPLQKNQKLFYPYIAQLIKNLVGSEFLTIWAVSPSQELMGLLVSTTPKLEASKKPLVIKISEALSGISVERQASSTRFDLTKDNPGEEYGFSDRKFQHSELITNFQIKQMISVPIYNSDHKNYTRMIINIFPSNDGFQMSDDELRWCGQAIATATDIILDRMCSVASTRVNFNSGTIQ